LLAEQALDSLKKNVYQDSLAIVAYHWRTSIDTVTPEEVVDTRAELYDIEYQGRAEIFVDGNFHVEEEIPENFGKAFSEAIDYQKGFPPIYDLAISYRLNQDQSLVFVSIFATDTPPGPVRFFIAVAEDSVMIGIPPTRYDYVVRSLIPDPSGSPLNIAYAESLDTAFAFENRWNADKIHIIGFIQDLSSKHILQAAIGTKVE